MIWSDDSARLCNHTNKLRSLCAGQGHRGSMRIEANERPYWRGLVRGDAPRFLWGIRRAQPMLEQRKLQEVRRSQNQIVFQRAYPGCFLPGAKGGVDVRSATASRAGEGSGKFRAGNRQRMCPIRFWFE